ncbi:DUF3369 domain-containing protein, partial [Escherichia coli]|uniref:DUF3369 domain-containing protein n=1 Tax=Escherichia coli TaxID=562 RepID=UPI00129008C7
LETKDSHDFASGVLTQLAAILKVGHEGLVCARRSGSPHDYYVQAATGRFFELEGLPLDLVTSDPQLDTLLKSVERRCDVYGDNGGLALHIGHKDEQDIVVFIDAEKSHSELDPQLLGVFCANLSTLLHNRGL